MSTPKGDDPNEPSSQGTSNGAGGSSDGYVSGEWGSEEDAARARRARAFQESSLDIVDLALVYRNLGRSLSEFNQSGMWLGKAGREAFWHRWEGIRDRADEHARRLKERTTI